MLTFSGKMVENDIQNDGHNIGVDVFFFNVYDVNVQTLDNIYDGIANGHLGSIISPSLDFYTFLVFFLLVI